MCDFEKEVMDDQAHAATCRGGTGVVPLRIYVKGWKISPSHYINQDLSTIWLSPPKCDQCTEKPVMAAK